MKVLFLTPWYPTDEKPNWGVFVREHAIALQNAGAEVEVWALCLVKTKDFWKAKINTTTSNGIKEKQVVVSTRLQQFVYNSPAWQRVLLENYFKLSKADKPNLIIGNVGYPAGMWAQELSIRWGVPYLVIEHWSGVQRFMTRSIWGAKLHKAFKGAKAVLSVSEFLGSQLQPYKIGRPIITLPNVVDTTSFAFKPNQPTPGTVRFCSAQELSPPKLPFLMLEALDALQKKTGITIIYNFVGGGPWEEELKTKAAKTSVQFQLLPRQNKAGLATIIQESDFLIHASSYETFGLIALEALATGTPVITSNLPSMLEFVTEGRGFTSENKTDYFVAVLEKLIAYPFLHETISAEITKSYSREAIGLQLFDICNKYLKK